MKAISEKPTGEPSKAENENDGPFGLNSPAAQMEEPLNLLFYSPVDWENTPEAFLSEIKIEEIESH